MNRNDENILKRFIKRKIAFTTSLMVGFLITGTLSMAAVKLETGTYYNSENNLDEMKIVSTTNKAYGLSVYNSAGNVSVKNGEIIVSNTVNDSIDGNNTLVKGIEVFNGGKLTLGTEKTGTVNISSETKQNGSAVGIHLFAYKQDGRNQSVNINADTTNITVKAAQGNATGISVGDGTNKSNNSEITINSNNTTIQARTTSSDSKNTSIGILAADEGKVKINGGNVNIEAENAIIGTGNSTIEINNSTNSKEKESNIIKINGDIVFQKLGTADMANGAVDTANSNIVVNLANSSSEFNGKISLLLPKNEEVDSNKKIVTGLKLTISNGATWNVKNADQKNDNNYIFGEVIVKDKGIINHSGVSYVSNNFSSDNENADKGIQMQGNATLKGNGRIQVSDEVLVEAATNVITVSNDGNIINGTDLILNGNVNMLDGSKLNNQGSLITSGTILVGSGATFTNEKGATLKGSSNKHLIEVTGGTAINNGTIDLSKTTGSIAMNGDKDSTLTNNGLVIVDYKGDSSSKVFGDNGTRTNTNTGKVQINGYDKDKNGKGDKIALENLLLGENATIENSGMFVDENGVAIVFEDDSFILGTTTETEIMENLNGKNSIDISKNGATIKADSSKIEGTADNGLKSLNVNGELNLVKGDTGNQAIQIENLTTNISGDTKIIIGEGATANFTNGTINGIENKTAIELSNNGTLGLKDMVVKGDIVKGGNATTTTVNMSGNNSINGKVDVSNVNISSGESTFGANSSFGTTTIKVENDGKLMLDVATDGTNAFLTTSNNGGKVSFDQNGTGSFGVSTGRLTEDQKIELGKNNDLSNANFVSNSDKTQDVYITKLIKDEGEDKNTIKVTYNKELLSNYGDKLNNINNAFQVINDKISQNAKDRAILADKVYAGTIYAETVRMAYDNSKLVENELVKINPEVPVGEWVANGKALFMKNQYDRDGILSSYNSEKESTGLLAVGEYGLDETTNVGLAFAGIKHKLDTDTGKADGDAFYFGTFAKKQLGDYRLNVGLGYELNRFDADENLFGGSEKYDANVYSAYVEGRYVKALGDDLRVEPKLKLGYTYVDQDSIKDGIYDIGSQDISVFDTEFGADFIKTVALKDGKLNAIFGVSYTLAFGDTDDEFTGRFYNSKAVGSSFNMMGAEIAERSLNLGAGLEVTKDTGLFYNGGVTFKTGSDSYRDYGFTLGAGYRF